MHIADVDKAMLERFPVGASIMPGGGLAAKHSATAAYPSLSGWASKGNLPRRDQLAAIWDLPVLFVCENNQYAIFTKQENVMRVKNVADRAAAYGYPV